MEKSKQNSCKPINHSTYQLKIVRMIGVEPTWITPPDPKSGASANFATSGNYFLFLCLVRLSPDSYRDSPHPVKGCKSKGFIQNIKTEILFS
jgi:hypothetical protein